MISQRDRALIAKAQQAHLIEAEAEKTAIKLQIAHAENRVLEKKLADLKASLPPDPEPIPTDAESAQ